MTIFLTILLALYLIFLVINHFYMADFDKKGFYSGNPIKGTLLALLFCLLPVISMGIYTVESGTVGVLATFGKYDLEEKPAGIHFKVPFAQNFHLVNVKQVIEEEKVPVLDRNNLPIAMHVSFKWRVLDSKAAEKSVRYGDNIYGALIKPIVRKNIRDMAGQYNGEDIAKQREKLTVEINDVLEKSFASLPHQYFEFLGADLRDITLDAVVMDKIKAVQVAKQREKELENEVLQAKQEQDQKIIKADTAFYEKTKAAAASAKATILRAEANAKKILMEAKAQAKANKLVSASLTKLLVDNNKITAWSGDLPKVTSNESMSMFLPSELAK